MHAASVYPEPGSNSLKKYSQQYLVLLITSSESICSNFTFSLGIINVVFNISVLLLRNLTSYFWFVFSTFLALFSLVFRCSIFKVRSLSALADSFVSISHLFLFVNTFFSKVFDIFRSVISRFSCPTLAELC